MAEQFAIGELAEGFTHVNGPPRWVEVTVCTGPIYHANGQFGYAVECPALGHSGHSTGRWFCPSLRKKRPPRDDLQIVRWADCPWQPEKVLIAQ